VDLAGRQDVLAGWVTARMVWPHRCAVVLAVASERLHSGGAFIERRLAAGLSMRRVARQMSISDISPHGCANAETRHYWLP